MSKHTSSFDVVHQIIEQALFNDFIVNAVGPADVFGFRRDDRNGIDFLAIQFFPERAIRTIQNFSASHTNVVFVLISERNKFFFMINFVNLIRSSMNVYLWSALRFITR